MFKDLLKKVALAAHKSAKFFLSFVCIIESIFSYSSRCNDYSYDVSSKKTLDTVSNNRNNFINCWGIIGYAIGYFFYKEVGIHIFEFHGFEGFKSFKDQIQIGKGFGLG